MRQKKLFLFILLSWFIGNQAIGQTYRAWIVAGDNSFENRRYAEAIAYYFKAAEFEIEDLDLYYKTSEALRNYNDYEKAATWYTKVILADKENNYPLALFHLAEMRKYIGNYPESKQLFDKYAAQSASDTSYYAKKARFERDNMEEAQRISIQNSKREVKSAGTTINSVYSDFGGTFTADSTFYYSSLRFLYKNTDKKEAGYYVTRILKTDPDHPQPQPESVSINLPEAHNSNIAISPDNRLMIFSRCPEAGDYLLKCELYESRNENGTWTVPVRIEGGVNLTGQTSTQPAIATRGAEGYTLFFVSDRPGGQGKNDIWKADRSATGAYTAPVNIGTPVNTFDDEATPFFDSPRQILFFSSYGHPGMGGLDVYRSDWTGTQFTTPENLLPPVNSSVNDIYFSLAPDTLTGSLASNRKGSMYISSQTCCYDIYFFKTQLPDSLPKDTVITPIAVVKEDLKLRTSYDDFLPLVLYFDNDYPDPRSRLDTTKRDYLSLYEEYIDSKPVYLEQFTRGLTGEPKGDAAAAIETFFADSVTASFNRLEGFCAKLERAMKEEIGITLEVRGRASPLAKTEYNVILSRRRIASLYNYLRIYNNGALAPYIDSGQLVLQEVPAGESLARSGISDQAKDKRNSIYNPDAAVERRIELINVVIKTKE
jgi:tetratricopeptide (TPR) repeat protein